MGSADAGCPGITGETVSWIVPYSAGGGYDVLSRLLEPSLEVALEAEVVVQNREGAGGLVGARAIQNAAPDGRTLGIVNGTGLLVQALEADSPGLDLSTDFTVLGRLMLPDPVWLTGAGSRYQSALDLFSDGDDRLPLFGMVEVGSSGFITASVGAELLGLQLEYLPGYAGSREATLALMRGEIDLAGFNFESVQDRIEAGDLRPLLRFSESPASNHAALLELPSLAGADGLAVRRARELGRDPTTAQARADAMARLHDVGRLAVAPPGLAPELATCLRQRVAQVVRDGDFLATLARTSWTVSYLDAPGVVSVIESTADARRDLAETMSRQIEIIRSAR